MLLYNEDILDILDQAYSKWAGYENQECNMHGAYDERPENIPRLISEYNKFFNYQVLPYANQH